MSLLSFFFPRHAKTQRALRQALKNFSKLPAPQSESVVKAYENTRMSLLLLEGFNPDAVKDYATKLRQADYAINNTMAKNIGHMRAEYERLSAEIAANNDKITAQQEILTSIRKSIEEGEKILKRG